MADIFAWVPDDSPTGDTKFNLLETKFGDGYSQAIVDGLNAKSETWPLKFDRSQTDIAPIKAFLDAHMGISFLWTPPDAGATQGYYRCKGYSSTPRSGNQETLSFTLQQWFSP